MREGILGEVGVGVSLAFLEISKFIVEKITKATIEENIEILKELQQKKKQKLRKQPI